MGIITRIWNSVFYHGANDWWILPKTGSQLPSPPYEGPLGETPARIKRMLTAMTSGDRHATPWFYAWVGVILAIVTLAEVWIFTFETLGPWFVPVLLILSLFKFVMVVAFFMHLRFDNKLFTWIFGAGFTIGVAVFLAILALFFKLNG